MTALYLNEQQTIVKKRDDYLVVQYPDKHTVEVPLIKVTQVIVSGDITLTTPALHTLLAKGIELGYLFMYGHYRRRLSPPVAKNAFLRREQYRAHADPQRALAVAQACMKGKLENIRTMLLHTNRSFQHPEITKAALSIQH